jgi:hypothetical protein
VDLAQLAARAEREVQVVAQADLGAGLVGQVARLLEGRLVRRSQHHAARHREQPAGAQLDAQQVRAGARVLVACVVGPLGAAAVGQCERGEVAVGVEFSPRDRPPERAVSRQPHALVEQVAAVVECVGPQRAAGVDHAGAQRRHVDELGGLGDPLELLVAEAEHKAAGLLRDDAAPRERRGVGLVHVLEDGLLGVVDDPRDAVTQHADAARASGTRTRSGCRRGSW